MLNKRSKYFFWSAVLGAVLLILQSLKPTSSTVELSQSMGSELASTLESASAEVAKRLPSSLSDSRLRPGQEVKEPEKVHMPEYVQIGRKYYMYNPKHLYNVDGELVYYVDSRKQVDPENPYAKENSSVRKSTSSVTHEMLDANKLNALSSFDPASPQKMMRVLKEAQSRMKQRNQYLDELMNQ